jgi:hypothetical protein
MGNALDIFKKKVNKRQGDREEQQKYKGDVR